MAAPPAGVRLPLPGPSRRVLVWDWAVRLFHWLTAVLVGVAYGTARLGWMGWHVWVGEAVLALVLFRLLWGVAGSDTARFARFVAGPRAALRHLRHVFRREPDTGVGHNPAGGWMVLAFLVLLLTLSLSGIYVNNDVADEGPLTELSPAWLANLLTDLHTTWLWDALLAAVALHVLAIAHYALVKRHDLVRPMLTGRKRLPAAVAAPWVAPSLRAVVLLAVGGAAAAGIAAFL